MMITATRKYTILTTTYMAIVAATLVGHEPQASLAGRWVYDAAKSSASGRIQEGMSPGDLVVTQTSDTVVVERQIPALNTSLRLTYRLDGKGTSNAMGFRNGEPCCEAYSTAKWHEGALEVATRSDMGDSTEQYRVEGEWLVHSVTPAGRGTAGPLRMLYFKRAQS